MINTEDVKETEKEFEPQYPAELYDKRPNATALLSPLYDSTFKAMFTQGTEDSNLALKSFISAVLGRNVSEVRWKPNEPVKDTTDQKGMSFDVCVEFDNGEISDIEMQAFKQDYNYGTRAEIQSARLLSNNAKMGDVWDSPKVYQISILNFHYRKDDKQSVSCYTMRDDSGKGLTDRQNIIFVDLKTIRKMFGTPIEELSPVEKWGLFLSFVDNTKAAGYISQIVRSEKGIMAAENTVKYMSEADDNWFTQNSRFIYERDRNTVIRNAEKRGIEKGAQEKAEEVARSLYANGVSIELIAKSLKMTEDQVREIVNTPVAVKA